ncbi:MAG: TIGR03546 family protein [Treponema sp.]|jgi:uncharacterized protein (TIGR03546 family)|nr:TIGR03546 family protein [Treponema sp.]
MIKATAKLLIALNGNAKKSQIAAGFAWGLLLGLVPTGAFWIALFIITFFFNHNHGAKIFGMAFIKLLMIIPGPNQLPLIPQAIDTLGFYILNIDSLKPVFTSMYNMPFVPFTKFNNTLVAGGIICGVLLWFPSFFLFMYLIPVYRNKVAPKIRDSKFVQKITKFPLLSMIDKAMKGV